LSHWLSQPVYYILTSDALKIEPTTVVKHS
jgi:hypothetical protein